MKKRALLTAAVLAAALLFAGCAGNGRGDVTDLPPVSSGEAEDTADLSGGGTLNVIDGSGSSFRIVFPDGCDPERLSAVRYMNVLKARTGAVLPMIDDFLAKDGDGKNEILIGAVNRTESEEFISSLPEAGYGYTVTKDKIVIAGRNPSLTAMALYSFENSVLFEKEFCGEGQLELPVGKTAVYTKKAFLTQKEILEYNGKLCAWTENSRLLGGRNGFSTAQGAATDGTYFYNVLHKKVDGAEKIMLLKSLMEGDAVENRKTALLSEVMRLGHGNDLCYNPDDGWLVLVNMEGTRLTLIDPETLTVIRTVEPALPGTAYAIGYCSARQNYVIAAGGVINITDRDFSVVRSIPIHSETNYVGQGMDCDENFIFMPLSKNGKETKNNVISVYSWDGYLRTAVLDTGAESETIFNWDGKYYINFNSGGPVVADLHFDVVYN